MKSAKPHCKDKETYFVRKKAYDKIQHPHHNESMTEDILRGI